MEGVDEWRAEVLSIVSAFVEPLAVLLVLAAFSLGLFTVRAIA